MDKKMMLEMVHMMLESVNVNDSIVLNNIRAMSVYKQVAPTNYSLMLADISQLVLKSDGDTPVLEPNPHINPLDIIACDTIQGKIITDILLILDAVHQRNILLISNYLGELSIETTDHKDQVLQVIRLLEKFKNGELNLCHAKINPKLK